MASTKTEPASPPLSFEKGMAELEAVVERLESGELSLEEALQCFERGIRLVGHLNQVLNQAEQRVEVLLRGPDGELRVETESGGEEQEEVEE